MRLTGEAKFACYLAKLKAGVAWRGMNHVPQLLLGCKSSCESEKENRILTIAWLLKKIGRRIFWKLLLSFCRHPLVLAKSLQLLVQHAFQCLSITQPLLAQSPSSVESLADFLADTDDGIHVEETLFEEVDDVSYKKQSSESRPMPSDSIRLQSTMRRL